MCIQNEKNEKFITERWYIVNHIMEHEEFQVIDS